MDQEHSHTLIRRLIERVESNTSDLAPEPLNETASFFLCPERFKKEKQQFFLDTPQVIGFAGELAAPNSFLTSDVCGVPVLVLRDSQGVLRAFINACAHKGARVAQGRGVQPRFSCRFHGWTYADSGALYGRPQADCFASDQDQRGLQALPVSDRSGLIVVGVQPYMPQTLVDEHLEEIAPELQGFDFQHMHFLESRCFEVKANWKLVAGLSYESYHFATLHRDSVAQWLKSNYLCDFFGRHSRWCFSLKGIERLKDKPEAEWPRFVPGAVSHAFFPGTVMITNPEDAQIIRTEPGETPDTSIVYYSGVYRYAEKKDASQAAYDFGGRAFEDEDLPAAVECQRGLSAGRRDFPIGRNEAVVQFWHRQWRDALN
jgi:phenylpropionate dioxygenase-like ring-hydroxylating dioxygenase large terminal subunit